MGGEVKKHMITKIKKGEILLKTPMQSLTAHYLRKGENMDKQELIAQILQLILVFLCGVNVGLHIRK